MLGRWCDRMALHRASLLAAAVSLFAFVPVWASEVQVSLDPARTTIALTLDATMHKVRGTAPVQKTVLRLDPEARTLVGRIVVDARLVTTANEGRDAKMHAEVLESAAHPEITFELKRFEGNFVSQGLSKLTVSGDFSIHGRTHPLSFPLEATVSGTTLEARGSFKIPFVAWGMKDPSVFVLRVAKEVLIEIDAKGTLITTAPAAGAAPREGS